MPPPSPLSGMAPSEGPPGLISEDWQAHMEESGPLGNQVLSHLGLYMSKKALWIGLKQQPAATVNFSELAWYESLRQHHLPAVQLGQLQLPDQVQTALATSSILDTIWSVGYDPKGNIGLGSNLTQIHLGHRIWLRSPSHGSTTFRGPSGRDLRE